jgi:hypothetical protein
MRRREIVLLAFALVLALSTRLERASYAEVPQACQSPDVTGLDPRLPCTVPIDVEVNDREVLLRWSTAQVESILGDSFGGYKIWRWRVPRGYNVRDPLDQGVLLPDTSSYALLQVLARRDTTALHYPYSFSEVAGEWTFVDPGSLFTFTKVGSLYIGPGGVEDSVFFFKKIPREESGPINGFPYYYSVTYFGRVVDTLFATPEDTVPPYITVGLSSKMPDPAGDFTFPVYPGGRPTENLGEVMVIPNPYSDHASWEYFGRRKIQFVNLPDRSKVDIFTAAGDLVRTLRLEAGAKGTGAVNTLDWDLRSGAGEVVTAGVYIYRVESPDGRDYVGRFAVIR